MTIAEYAQDFSAKCSTIVLNQSIDKIAASFMLFVNTACHKAIDLTVKVGVAA